MKLLQKFDSTFLRHSVVVNGETDNGLTDNGRMAGRTTGKHNVSPPIVGRGI